MQHKIYVPLRIVSESNLRECWQAKLNRKKKQRKIIQTECRAYIRDKIKLPARILFTRVAPRSLDDDNLVTGLKTVRDTIADLLIPWLKPGRADEDGRILFEYCQKRGDPKEYGLMIEIFDEGDACVVKE